MNKKESPIWFILLLVLIVAALAYNYFATPFLDKFQAAQNTKEKESQAQQLSEAEKKQQVLDNLTTREKIAQLLAVTTSVKEATQSAEVINQLSQTRPGWIVLSGDGVSSVSAQLAVKTLQEAADYNQLKTLFGVDQVGSVAESLTGTNFNQLSTWRAICQMKQEKLESQLEASSQQLGEIGINFVLGPNLDLATSNYYLANQGCSNQEQLELAASAFIKAYGSSQIMPVATHYPGMGLVATDPFVQSSTVQLREKDAGVFRETLNTFPNIGVLTAQLRLKDKFDQLPCAQSQTCLSPFLESTDYQQVLLFAAPLDQAAAAAVSEDQPESNHLETDPLVNRAIRAIKAGNHVLFISNQLALADLDSLVSQLAQKYDQDQELQETVDQRLLELIELKYKKDDEN